MERTYVFNSDGGNGGSGGSKLDITAMLPGMFGNKGIDPNLLALMNNGNGFGGQDGWWSIIWLVVIASIFGWNGNGGGLFGGRGGNGANGLPAELAGNAGRELLMQAIQGNGNAISQLASSFNCSTQQVQTALCNVQNSITQVGNQVGLSTNQIINAMQSGNQSILTQLADCCCKTQTAIERQGYEGRLQNCESMNALTNTMNNNALSLRDGATANTNAILAKLDAIQNQALQDKIASLTAEKATLTAEISQRNQNATILSAVGQQIAPLAAGLQALQGDVDKIKCKLPNTVSVQYPNLTAINTDCFRAAAYGAYMGDAVYGRSGCGFNNYWG
ncbi:hypothetical protein [Phocaeicola massiliensis]|jgi:hypothetical protein|uniref:hypothetical protein n=1 Tax=Phocaeicola massiliensis TaxID=204516 RepID=UPI0032EF9AE8